MLIDTDEELPREEELAEARYGAEKDLHRWKKRAVYATVAFVLSCASVVPFLYGNPLHVYWESFGKYLVLLSMALLLPFVMCVGIAINSWFYVRALREYNS